MTQAERDALVMEQMPFAERLGRRYARRLPDHAEVDADDIRQMAFVGLLDALGRWPEGTPVHRGHLGLAMKHAVIDGLRRLDMLPRAKRSEVKDGTRVHELHSLGDKDLAVDSMAAVESHIMWTQLLAHLPPRKQRILELQRLGYLHREIADRTEPIK